MGDEVVLYEVEDRVAIVTLNRPDRLNAWTGEMQTRCFDLLDESAADPGVVAVVVTGAGRGFCAGADMDVLQGLSGDGAGGSGRREGRPATWPATIPKPVIGAINGACAGIGLALAMAFDVRLAAAGAKFTTAFARRGLIAEHGLSWLLPQIVGRARAMDLLLSARVVLAEEAAEMGLVNRVLPPEDLLPAAVAYAAELAANCSPTSMSVIKDQLNRHPVLDLDEAADRSGRLMAESLQRPDFKEGVASFLEKRPPSFLPLPETGHSA